MNEFYDICTSVQSQNNEYQLRDMGSKQHMMTVGTYGRPGRQGTSSTIYRTTTREDYDLQMAHKLSDCNPPYQLTEILNHHFNFYTENNGDEEIFLKQIKYVILPIIKKHKNKDIHAELVKEWLVSKTDVKSPGLNSSVSIGDIYAPTQLQFNSDNSSQIQDLRMNSDDVREFIRTLEVDIQNLQSEIREDFEYEIGRTIKQLENNKDIRGRLMILGGLIKDVGINTFANVIASPVFELLKPYLGI